MSYLIDNRILFDTGSDHDVLMNNLDVLKVSLSQIESIVISHEHWDHIDGMWGVLKKRPGIKVFVCKDVSVEFKEKILAHNAVLIEVFDPVEINKNIYSTGQIMGLYKDAPVPEQALLVKQRNKYSLYSGCAHAGIVETVNIVNDRFSIILESVAGGFHLKDEPLQVYRTKAMCLKNLGIKYVDPRHCTSSPARLEMKAVF